MGSWAQLVGKIMPLVTAWAQERWDIEVVPKIKEKDEENEIEKEGTDDEAEKNAKFKQDMKKKKK